MREPHKNQECGQSGTCPDVHASRLSAAGRQRTQPTQPRELRIGQPLEYRDLPPTAPWGLLRKFNLFWPKGAGGPPMMPWLAQLVSRRKAWRWASQFPSYFENIEPHDFGRIMEFVGATLQDVEISGDSEKDGKGDKSCCGKKPKGGGPRPGGRKLPPIEGLPDSEKDCITLPVMCTFYSADDPFNPRTEPADQTCCWNQETGQFDICDNPCEVVWTV